MKAVDKVAQKAPISSLGLSSQKTSDAIAAFVKQYGKESPRRAVFCTYDFDPVRFEAVLMPELNRRGKRFRTLVLADAAAIQNPGMLGRASSSSYELAPVRVNGSGVFHPKLIFIQAGSHVLVGIGSGNLTAGGLGGNLELMLFSGNETKDGQALAASALQFLDDLRKSKKITIPNPTKSFLERVCISSDRMQGGPVLHSLDSPLLDQLKDSKPKDKIERIAIMSPWHSAAANTAGIEPEVLRKIEEIFGKTITVYTQGQDKKAPDLGGNIDVKILTDSAMQDDNGDEDEEELRRSSRLHAKAYIAIAKSTATLWFGSANCTMPALCNTAGTGNVELLVVVKLTKENLAHINTDFDKIFGDPIGTFHPEEMQPIPSPKGRVIAGHAKGSGNKFKLTLEFIQSKTTEIITISGLSKNIEIKVSPNQQEAILTELCQDDEVPAVLWEHVKNSTVPFPVSFSCAPESDDPENMLQDVLDDLAGRVPSPPRKNTPHQRPSVDNNEDSDEEYTRDDELEMLTKSAHEGQLDRIAVRVEALRRRLSKASNEQIKYYETIIAKLNLAESLKKILISHLDSKDKVQ